MELKFTQETLIKKFKELEGLNVEKHFEGNNVSCLEKYLYFKNLNIRIEVISYFLEFYYDFEEDEILNLTKILVMLENDFVDVSFENLFNCVFSFQFSERKTINNILKITSYIKEKNIFNVESSINLNDSLIYFWYANSNKNKDEKIETEKEYEERVIENFTKIFPNYNFVKNQFILGNKERIDIFAEEKTTKRPVIIELKINNKNPKKQLILYGSYFENPILISLTKEECKNKHEKIIYKTYK